MSGAPEFALAVVLVLANAGLPAPGAGCTCLAAMELDGFCAEHQLGYLGGIEIVSPRLYEALDAHGHEVNLSTFDCPTCRSAIEAQGFCDEHRVGFVGGLAYFSRLTHALAGAERGSTVSITCPTCRAHVADGGWCPSCRLGRLGTAVFRDEREFAELSRAVALVRQANAAAERCLDCAVAIITDTICVRCRLEYTNGTPRPFVPRALTGELPLPGATGN